jgi:hypothetical protein
MNIGLDYDDTCTLDMNFWIQFVKLSRAHGHEVYLTTMRSPMECNEIPMALLTELTGIVPTSRQAKEKAVRELGISISVWADDQPKAIHHSALEIWGNSSPTPEDRLGIPRKFVLLKWEDGGFKVYESINRPAVTA